MSGRVAILQFPGVNCEAETARALQRVGLEPVVVRGTADPAQLSAFDAFVLPGGFSWQDRVRAGALAAKHPLVEGLAREAAAGKPVLGICNGAQVLVESGLVPGGRGVEVALARNRMPERTGYQARWVHCRIEASPCLFTRHLEPGSVLALPVAHGEGRFTSRTRGRMARLLAQGQVPLRYARADGGPAEDYPDNPNGSEVAAAALCNAAGNVLAMMPHPERVLDLGAIDRTLAGPWHERQAAALAEGGAAPFGDAPGVSLFRGLAAALAAVA